MNADEYQHADVRPGAGKSMFGVEVVTLALRLGYGRGGPRGCAIPYEELARLRASLTGEELEALIERVRQLDNEHIAQTAALEREAEPTRDRSLPRQWFRPRRRDR